MASATLPVRDLGSIGLVTDIDPYNLPINGFTTADNIRFDEGKVKRSVLFRTVKDSLGFTPRACFGVVPPTGFDTVLVVSDNWVINEYANNALTNRSGSITGSSSPKPYTINSLADVVYINRPDRVPVYRLPSGTNFSDLTNWDSNWRCEAMRPFGEFLMALNVTETNTNYPNRIRFSNIVQANAIPDSWDATDATKSAGFVDLVQMQTPIKDGLELGSNFLIYSSSEVFSMDFVGGSLLFSFRKLFSDDGVINQNCIVEADGKHFVFGNSDIYTTDGNTKISVADKRIRQSVYKSLNVKNSDRCFVQHNKVLSEIYFCFQAGDSTVNFPNTTRCNRAAVLNYRDNTWSMIDLPNVSSGTTANVDTVTTYADATETYETIGGTFHDQEDSFNRHTLMIGQNDTDNGITSDKLYALDLSDSGSSVAFAIDTQATKPPVLERVGIDLDETGQSIDGYKVLTRVLPQFATLNQDNTNVTFEFGASDIPSDVPTYGAPVTFNIASDYKLDSRASGRYLSYKITLDANDYKDFSFSGMDFDISTTGAK